MAAACDMVSSGLGARHIAYAGVEGGRAVLPCRGWALRRTAPPILFGGQLLLATLGCGGGLGKSRCLCQVVGLGKSHYLRRGGMEQVKLPTYGRRLQASHIARAGVRGVEACHVSADKHAGDRIQVQNPAPEAFV